MSDNNKQNVANVLRILKKNDVPLQKIILHKFIYFLNTQNFSTGFKFEPYTYGPFSFELASTIGSMIFWEEIKESRYTLDIVDLSEYSQPKASVEKQIESLLTLFKEAVGDFNFDNLECAGTVLYCAESLVSQDKKVTKKSIEQEFKAWKGTDYDSETIQAMYTKLKPYIH